MMQIESKHKPFWIIGVIGALVIIGQGIYNWKLTQEVAQLKQDQAASNATAYSSAIPWRDPMASIAQARKQMDDMMNSFSSTSPFWEQSFFNAPFSQPDIQMDESNGEYKVTVEVPEGQQVELNTELSDNRLSISGQVKNTQENALDNLFSNVSSLSQFSRSLYLSDPVNESAMKTEHDGNRVLITIPKV